MALEVPGIVRYEQNHAVAAIDATGVGDGPPGFDGYSSGWWTDYASYQSAMQSDEWSALLEDGAAIFDHAWLWGMSAQLEEFGAAEGTRDRSDGFKVAWVLRFRRGLSEVDALRRWTGEHAELASRLPGLCPGGYVQNQAIAAIGDGGIPSDDIELGFDGFAELRFADRAAYEFAMHSDEWQAVLANTATLLDPDFGFGMSVVLDEYVMR